MGAAKVGGGDGVLVTRGRVLVGRGVKVGLGMVGLVAVFVKVGSDLAVWVLVGSVVAAAMFSFCPISNNG